MTVLCRDGPVEVKTAVKAQPKVRTCLAEILDRQKDRVEKHRTKVPAKSAKAAPFEQRIQQELDAIETRRRAFEHAQHLVLGQEVYSTECDRRGILWSICFTAQFMTTIEVKYGCLVLPHFYPYDSLSFGEPPDVMDRTQYALGQGIQLKSSRAIVSAVSFSGKVKFRIERDLAFDSYRDSKWFDPSTR